jgi:hypothetical protein
MQATSFAKPEQYLLTSMLNTTDLQDIQHLPTPPYIVVESLAKTMDGTKWKSIQCPHVGMANDKRYPLWIISYWVKSIPIRTIRQKWAKADEALQRQSKLHHGIPASNPGLIRDVYNNLSCIPWGRYI